MRGCHCTRSYRRLILALHTPFCITLCTHHTHTHTHTHTQKMTAVNKEIPFLHCHGEPTTWWRHHHLHWYAIHITSYYIISAGDSDITVSLKWGELSSQFIKTFNKSNYQFKIYSGLGHHSCPEVNYCLYRPFSTITNYDIIGGQNRKQSWCIVSLNTALLSYLAVSDH